MYDYLTTWVIFIISMKRGIGGDLDAEMSCQLRTFYSDSLSTFKRVSKFTGKWIKKTMCLQMVMEGTKLVRSAGKTSI